MPVNVPYLPAGPGRELALGLYAAQLTLNLAWTPLFFKSHRLSLATYDGAGVRLLPCMQCQAGCM